MADESVFPGLHWLHHASFRIETQGKVIYIDPYKLKGSLPADLIFVTHAHTDHYSEKDIAKIMKPGTTLVCPVQVAAKARAKGWQVEEVRPGSAFDVDGVKGRAVPSYNVSKPMHPKKHGNVGYIFDLPQGRLYHAGDSDLIEEMSGFSGIKLALLPVGRIFRFLKPTMDPEQAAAAVAAIQPDFASPMHYGLMPGTKRDGLAFAKAAGKKAVILEMEEP